ncbi:sugar-binding transcriptional regulator [Cryobacterium lactosi]|nr:sugar-binding domain-containing protein [Cryobacterium lactosi]
MGISRQSEAAYVAKRYLIDRKSKVEIAKEIRSSRFRVARLIDEAYNGGCVRISVDLPIGVDFEISTQLRERFGLQHAAVVHSGTRDAGEVRQALAPVAASFLTEVIREGDVLGITPGRTLRQLDKYVTELPYCDVVQLTGVANPNIESGMGVVARLAAVSRGRAHFLYSPLTVSEASVAEGIRRQPAIRRTLSRIDDLDVAFVTIGSWDPPQSQLFDNMVDEDFRTRLLGEGIHGEVGATLIHEDGRLSEQLAPVAIAVTAAQLAQARNVIAVAGGTGKTTAIRAALLSGMVNTLITDAFTAQELLV